MFVELLSSINAVSVIVIEYKRHNLQLFSKHSIACISNNFIVHMPRNWSFIFEHPFHILNNCMYSINMCFRILICRNKYTFIFFGLLVFRNIQFKCLVCNINLIILYDAKHLYIYFLFFSVSNWNFNQLRNFKHYGIVDFLC